MTTQAHTPTPLSGKSLYNLLREYGNAAFDTGVKDASGDKDTQALIGKILAIESELYRREKEQAAEIARLREALRIIKLDATSLDSCVNIAREALQAQEVAK